MDLQMVHLVLKVVVEGISFSYCLMELAHKLFN
ncbi:hypothetical protein UA11_05883 [Burkholderia multivorans]|nr:hypothetical protein UA12_05627 [Burkholderia multivorans]SAJ97266.1 hypothetical protein UA12_05645 [Burkholderia multivorans]SAJ97551.1 hypothetical protein UA11_05864 [Burkholderia multivorans]SAJ97663.1 hypothetical protein UA11_05883 [Burkholderia multivorans]